MSITQIIFFVGVGIAIMIFLKMSSRIPLEKRILYAALIPVCLVLLFIFLSALLSFLLLFILILILVALLTSKKIKIL